MKPKHFESWRSIPIFFDFAEIQMGFARFFHFLIYNSDNATAIRITFETSEVTHRHRSV